MSIVQQAKSSNDRTVPWLGWGLLLTLFGAYTSFSLEFFLEQLPYEEDILYIFLDGERLLNGENPYARILGGDMLHNQKYPTYFPGFYLFAALLQWAGLPEYPDWLKVWRHLVLIIQLAIAFLFFRESSRRAGWLLGLFLAGFWLFNRWVIENAEVAHVDGLAIMFLLLALIRFEANEREALLWLGCSLLVKQIALILCPFFLIWLLKKHSPQKAITRAFLWGGGLPVLFSLPFLLWNAEGYFKSIAFSATRLPSRHFDVLSIDEMMGWVGIEGKWPMLILLLLAFGLAARYDWNRYLACFVGLSIFTGFNAVLFEQYLVWPLAMVPMLIIFGSASTKGERPLPNYI